MLVDPRIRHREDSALDDSSREEAIGMGRQCVIGGADTARALSEEGHLQPEDFTIVYNVLICYVGPNNFFKETTVIIENRDKSMQ